MEGFDSLILVAAYVTVQLKLLESNKGNFMKKLFPRSATKRESSVIN